jgi:photosystem II stability/assembly factor-like uncharacterized protein
MFKSTLVTSIIIFSIVNFSTEQLYSQKIDNDAKTIKNSQSLENILPIKLYLQPDGTIKNVPYTQEYNQDIYVNGYYVEWTYPLPGDISENSFGLCLIGGSQGLNGTKFKAELILKTEQGETSFATTEFFGSYILTLPYYDLNPHIMTVALNGIKPTATLGDTLMVRISVVSGAAGRIMYGTNLGANYLITVLPVKPTLVNPNNDIQNQPVNLNLSWNSAEGAESYRLQVSTSSNFTTLVYDDSTITTTSKQVSGLSNSTKYFWRVRAKNAAGSSTWSEVWNFTTTTQALPPSTPTLANPNNNAQNQPLTLNLSWNSAEGAESYRLQVSTSSNFTTLVYDDSTITTTSKQVSGLSEATKYYWRVKAKNIAGSSPWSEVWNFSTTCGWISQSSSAMTWLCGVSFTDANTGTAVGYNGTILRTTNGGASWTSQSSGTMSLLYGVSFTDANNGTAVGDNGTILRTTNGGASWTSQLSGTTTSLMGVSFTDANNGTAVGSNGTILHTTNGGASWTSQSSRTTVELIGVSFTDANNGTAVGFNGTILHTTNGGASWTSQSSGTTNWILGASFTDANNGTVVGSEGTILHTANGGTIWTEQSIGTTYILRGVSFTDANNGTAVGNGGTIFRTTNGGATWTKQPSGTTRDLWGVSFTDANTGTVVGDGIILRTTSGGVLVSVEEDGKADNYVPNQYLLEQNYPNPFNPSTTISFNLPSRSFISLKVFDVIGREVATIVSEELPAGNHSRQWNAANISSGIYFYSLQAGTFAQTKKLILLR